MPREGGVVCEIVDYDQNLLDFATGVFLHVLRKLVLGVDDLFQCARIVVVEIDGILVSLLHLHVFFFVLLHRLPGHVHIDGRTEDVNATEAIPVNIQDHVLEEDGLPRPGGP